MRYRAARIGVLQAVVVVVCSVSCFSQAAKSGWNLVLPLGATMDPAGTKSSESIIDVLPFYNSTTKDICGAIAAAIASETSYLTLTFDARGIRGTTYCTTNPFAGTAAKGYAGKLLLGDTTIITSVQWNMPNQYFWIEGNGMSNLKSPAIGTIIQANNGMDPLHPLAFACANGAVNDYWAISNSTVSGCPVIFISGEGQTCSGSPVMCTPYDSFGTGIRNLAVDCNGVSGCIGAGSYDVQEGGGIDSVQFLNQPLACVAFDSRHAITVGATGISNPFLRNVNCGMYNPPTEPATLAGVGIYIYATDGPAEISNTTVNVPGAMSTAQFFLYCLYFDGGRGTNINFFHCEHAQNAAEFIGGSTGHAVSGASIRGLTMSTSLLGVNLNNATDTFVQDVEVADNPTGFMGSLQDGGTIIKAQNLAQYVTSTTTPHTGASATTNVITTDAVTPSVFYRETLTPVTISDLIALPAPPQGTLMYCSDCKQNTSMPPHCIAGGTSGGFLAVYNGTFWICK